MPHPNIPQNIYCNFLSAVADIDVVFAVDSDGVAVRCISIEYPYVTLHTSYRSYISLLHDIQLKKGDVW